MMREVEGWWGMVRNDEALSMGFIFRAQQLKET